MGKKVHMSAQKDWLNPRKAHVYGRRRKTPRSNPKFKGPEENTEETDKKRKYFGVPKVWRMLGINAQSSTANPSQKPQYQTAPESPELRKEAMAKISEAHRKAGRAKYLLDKSQNESLYILKAAKELYEEATGVKLIWSDGENKEEFWKNFIRIASALDLYTRKNSIDLNSIGYFQCSTEYCLIAADYYLYEGKKDFAKKYLSIVDRLVNERGYSPLRE